MKVLVATETGQGQRDSDFFFGTEGELVFFVLEGDCHFDGECGCRRSLAGATGATTTFKVEERNITHDEYVANCREAIIRSERWAADELDDIGNEIENEDAEQLLETGAKFPSGTILEKRGDEFFPRIIELSDAERILALIEQGESTTAEFKETLSLDIRKQTKESYIEHSALKTIAGFLNTNGGSLLVGISDDGKISGVNKEIEKFHRNTDRFLLHFKNLLKSKIGESYYPFINNRLVKVDNVHVLLVECKKSLTPCFLEGKDFYVRTNPATDKLEGPKVIEYIKHHFVN